MTRRFLLGLALLFLIWNVSAVLPKQTDVFLVRNVRVFDGDRLIPVASVLVRQGRIVAVGTEVAVPAGTEEIDGTGKTLLPGLIDAHAHARGSALREQLVFGVTTALDMATDPDWAAAMRQCSIARSGSPRFV